MTIMAQGSGADYVSGTFTVPENASSYTLSFGKTFGKYIYLIELTDESKATMMSSGGTYARTYCYCGFYPKQTIDSQTYDITTLACRIQPSTGSTSNGAFTPTFSGSEITFNAVGVTDSGWSSLVKGLTYKYFIVAIDE